MSKSIKAFYNAMMSGVYKMVPKSLMHNKNFDPEKEAGFAKWLGSKFAITHESIEAMGWKHVMSASDGGTKEYQLGKSMYVIRFHGDNFIYKKDNNALLTQIVISQLFVGKTARDSSWVALYTGHPKDIMELKQIIKDLNINDTTVKN